MQVHCDFNLRLKLYKRLAVEHAVEKPIMSSFHGIFSIAGLMSGVISAPLIGKIDEPYRALVNCSIGLAIIAFATPRLVPASIDKGKTDSPLAWPKSVAMGMGFLCFLAIMIEGVTIDWSGIYLREVFAVSGQSTALALLLILEAWPSPGSSGTTHAPAGGLHFWSVSVRC